MNYFLPVTAGQFKCGNKHCNEKDGLASYEASVYTSHNSRTDQLISPSSLVFNGELVGNIWLLSGIASFEVRCTVTLLV